MAIQHNDTVTLTRSELDELIDREAHARLGMSGAEFVRLYRDHKLPQNLAARDIAMLVRLAE